MTFELHTTLRLNAETTLDVVISAEIRPTQQLEVIETTGEPVPPPSLPPAPAAPRPLRHLQIVREAA